MIVGLLALQGAFLDHKPPLESLGAGSREVRTAEDLAGVDGIILPGGESTVMASFLKKDGLDRLLAKKITEGLPCWGICAGSVLLARRVDGKEGVLQSLDMEISRNAFGRQNQSRLDYLEIPHLGFDGFPCYRIRAPRIERLGSDVELLLDSNEGPLWVRQGAVMATTFHPELSEFPDFHRYFIELIQRQKKTSA